MGTIMCAYQWVIYINPFLVGIGGVTSNGLEFGWVGMEASTTVPLAEEDFTVWGQCKGDDGFGDLSKEELADLEWSALDAVV
jgi:hypothetical protein